LRVLSLLGASMTTPDGSPLYEKFPIAGRFLASIVSKGKKK
jgi:hypothetical protein